MAARTHAQIDRRNSAAVTANAGTDRVDPCDRTRPFRRGGTRYIWSCQRRPAPPHLDPHAGRERIPRSVRYSGAVTLSRRTSLHLLGGRPGVSRRISTSRIGYRNVRRQFQLARADLDAGQRANHPFPTSLLRLLWRQLQNRMSNWLREIDEPVRGSARDRPAADFYLLARCRRAPTGLWRDREVPKRSALARLPALLRILSWRQWRWNWRQPPNRMDRRCRHP